MNSPPELAVEFRTLPPVAAGRVCLTALPHYNGSPMKSIRLLIFLIPLCAFAEPGQKADPVRAAHKALAAVSGQLRAPGLERPVDVLRDRWGVAHIYARTQHDLFLAQGVVAAQDRLFQMELWKRAGQGRLAEILGPSALPRDVKARALRYRGDMQAEYESYSPDTKAILTAFTDGINSHIDSLTAPGGPGLPIEFQVAGFSPDAWHPEDCLNRMAAFSMTGNALSELEHAQALTELGDEAALAGFLRWDGKLGRESSEAVLYEVWFQQICLALGERFSKEHGGQLSKLSGRYDDLEPNTVLRLLTNPDKGLFGDNAVAGRDQVLANSLRAARQELVKLLGSDTSEWSWGRLHTVHFRHALDQQPGVNDLFDLGPLSRPGDEYTVNATGAYGDSWEQVSGASYREILDTSDWDQSVAVNTPGQSGQPGSPHYSDLLPLWSAGRYFPLLYSRKAVEDETTDRLVLEP